MLTHTYSHSRRDSHDSHDDHTHGAVDPLILTTDRGIWALKWSLLGLLATAFFQLAVVWLSGSVALFADTIHNFGDAATAIPCGLRSDLHAGAQAGVSPTATVVWKILPV